MKQEDFHEYIVKYLEEYKETLEQLKEITSIAHDEMNELKKAESSRGEKFKKFFKKIELENKSRDLDEIHWNLALEKKENLRAVMTEKIWDYTVAEFKGLKELFIEYFGTIKFRVFKFINANSYSYFYESSGLDEYNEVSAGKFFGIHSLLEQQKIIADIVMYLYLSPRISAPVKSAGA